MSDDPKYQKFKDHGLDRYPDLQFGNFWDFGNSVELFMWRRGFGVPLIKEEHKIPEIEALKDRIHEHVQLPKNFSRCGLVCSKKKSNEPTYSIKSHIDKGSKKSMIINCNIMLHCDDYEIMNVDGTDYKVEPRDLYVIQASEYEHRCNRKLKERMTFLFMNAVPYSVFET